MYIYEDLSSAQKRLVTISFAAGFVFLGVFVLGLALYYGALAVAEWKNIGDRDTFSISVSGEGSVFLKPDIATIYLTVTTQAPLLQDAARENTGKNNKIIAFLKSKGVEEKDIKTTSYNVSPQYQYDNRPCSGNICPPNSPPKIVGYEVNNSVEVKVRQLDALGGILDGAVGAGANNVSGPNFTVDDESVAKDAARKIALEKAIVKAEILAREMGVSLVRVAGYSESGNNSPVYYKAFDSAIGRGGAETAMVAPSIEPGQNEVVVGILLTYEVR